MLHVETLQSHKESIILSHDENQKVFALIEPTCLSLSTAVVQLYSTAEPDGSTWNKYENGVLCLIRDINKHSHCLRMYCRDKESMVWEYDLNPKISFKRVGPKYVTFVEPNNTIGISFTSEEEAHDLYINAVKYTQRRSNKKMHAPSPPIINIEDKQLASNSPEIKQNLDRDPLGLCRPVLIRKTGLSKKHIGYPTNFMHVAHIGNDQEHGFEMRGPINDLKTFLNINTRICDTIDNAPSDSVQQPEENTEMPPVDDLNLLLGSNRPLVQRKAGIKKDDISNPLNFVHLAHVGCYDNYSPERESTNFEESFDQQNDAIDEDEVQPSLKSEDSIINDLSEQLDIQKLQSDDVVKSHHESDINDEDLKKTNACKDFTGDQSNKPSVDDLIPENSKIEK